MLNPAVPPAVAQASLQKQHAILDIRLWLELPCRAGQLDLTQGLRERVRVPVRFVE